MTERDGQIEKRCEELHEYLRSKLNRNWRLETWRDKYRARIRKYGLDACKRAVDGFCNSPNNWYVRTVPHRAPELIFRSDKAMETFLAMAPEPASGNPGGQSDINRRERFAEMRARIEAENADLTSRFHRRITGLKDRINVTSRAAFIEPLLVVGMDGGTVVLFHEQASWVQDHYGLMIENEIDAPVKVVNEIEGD